MSAKFIYSLDFIIKTELTPQFEYSFGKVIEAHVNHEKGLGKKMQFFRSFADEKDIISIKVPMESLCEMDLWQHTPEIVLEYYGKEEGMKILQEYCDSTQLWVSRITKPYDPLSAVINS